MKKILLTATLLLGISATANAQSAPRYAGDDAAVGEVRTSLLTPEYFSKLYGPDWALMDGRKSINGEPLMKYMDKETESNPGITVPDAQGRFLRMIDHTGTVDPDGLRFPGNQQSDAFQGHTHKMEASGGTPIYKSLAGTGPSRRAARSSWRNRKVLQIQGPIKYGHGDVRVSNETRPKNIAVNYYVRVSCTTAENADYFNLILDS